LTLREALLSTQSKKWKEDIDAKVTLQDEKPIPVVLLANKCDLVKTPCSEEIMNEYIKEHGFAAWFATSAKENINITEAVNTLVEHIRKSVGSEDGFNAPRSSGTIPVASGSATKGDTQGGCCFGGK